MQAGFSPEKQRMLWTLKGLVDSLLRSKTASNLGIEAFSLTLGICWICENSRPRIASVAKLPCNYMIRSLLLRLNISRQLTCIEMN